MGVPGFFGWLVQHCRNCLVTARQPGSEVTDEQREKNPNDVKLSRTQMDCLYLDMNGIIHPCCHPDTDSPATEEEMMARICLKVDQIMDVVRPTTLLFLAIDGTAPRAKMNQQRTRRFRGAQLSKMEADIISQVKEEWNECQIPPPSDDLLKQWDSNVITPGTPFMVKVSATLRYYIQLRLNSDPKWANLAVILSDANEPGEGEHKIIQYIKRQRLQDGYKPNTTHCIVGEDADLIMRALSIRTPHMYILRGASRRQSSFKYLVVSVIEGYFAKCFQPILNNSNIPDEGKVLARMIDDLTLCFCLVGNDFLPHVPGMKIQHNAIAVALLAYIECFPQFNGGYLTDNGDINFDLLCIMIEKLKSNFRSVSSQDSLNALAESMQSKPLQAPPSVVECLQMSQADRVRVFKQQVKYHLDMHIERDIAEAKGSDKVLVGTEGWEKRYYDNCFTEELNDLGHNPSQTDSGQLRKKIVFEYLKGLNWVVAYYFKECPSWEWFYPYHYAPVLSSVDVGEISEYMKHNELYAVAKPYAPFEQLTAVLPETTASKVLPKAFVKQVTSKNSVLHKYYPETFHVDMSNCPPPWHCTVVLPFIEDSVFLPVLKKLQAKIKNSADRRRNSKAPPMLFVGQAHPLSTNIKKFLSEAKSPLAASAAIKAKVDTRKKRKRDSDDISVLTMAEDSQISASLIVPVNEWDKKTMLGKPLNTSPFSTEEWRSTFPDIEDNTAAKAYISYPDLNNISEVLEGTEYPNHDERLKPSRKCKKPSHSFQSRVVEMGLPIVLQPGKRLDALQVFWKEESLPCLVFWRKGGKKQKKQKKAKRKKMAELKALRKSEKKESEKRAREKKAKKKQAKQEIAKRKKAKKENAKEERAEQEKAKKGGLKKTHSANPTIALRADLLSKQNSTMPLTKFSSSVVAMLDQVKQKSHHVHQNNVIFTLKTQHFNEN